jgi:hypothetical protein
MRPVKTAEVLYGAFGALWSLSDSTEPGNKLIPVGFECQFEKFAIVELRRASWAGKKAEMPRRVGGRVGLRASVR